MATARKFCLLTDIQGRFISNVPNRLRTVTIISKRMMDGILLIGSLADLLGIKIGPKDSIESGP